MKQTRRMRELVNPEMQSISVPADLGMPGHMLLAGAMDAGCCGKSHVGVMVTLDDEFNTRMEEGPEGAMATAIVVAALVLEKLPDMLEATLGEDVVRVAMVAMMHRRRMKENGISISVNAACQHALALVESADRTGDPQNN